MSIQSNIEINPNEERCLRQENRASHLTELKYVRANYIRRYTDETRKIRGLFLQRDV